MKKKRLYMRLCSATSARLKQNIIKIVSWKTVSSFRITFARFYFSVGCHLFLWSPPQCCTRKSVLWIVWYASSNDKRNNRIKLPILALAFYSIWKTSRRQATKRAPFANWLCNLVLAPLTVPHIKSKYAERNAYCVRKIVFSERETTCCAASKLYSKRVDVQQIALIT